MYTDNRGFQVCNDCNPLFALGMMAGIKKHSELMDFYRERMPRIDIPLVTTMTCEICKVGKDSKTIIRNESGFQICESCNSLHPEILRRIAEAKLAELQTKKRWQAATEESRKKAAAEQLAAAIESSFKKNTHLDLDSLAKRDLMDAEIVAIEKQLQAGRKRRKQ